MSLCGGAAVAPVSIAIRDILEGSTVGTVVEEAGHECDRDVVGGVENIKEGGVPRRREKLSVEWCDHESAVSQMIAAGMRCELRH